MLITAALIIVLTIVMAVGILYGPRYDNASGAGESSKGNSGTTEPFRQPNHFLSVLCLSDLMQETQRRKAVQIPTHSAVLHTYTHNIAAPFESHSACSLCLIEQALASSLGDFKTCQISLPAIDAVSKLSKRIIRPYKSVASPFHLQIQWSPPRCPF